MGLDDKKCMLVNLKKDEKNHYELCKEKQSLRVTIVNKQALEHSGALQTIVAALSSCPAASAAHNQHDIINNCRQHYAAARHGHQKGAARSARQPEPQHLKGGTRTRRGQGR